MLLFAISTLLHTPQQNPIPAQPLLAQARRISEALDYLGNPLPAAAKRQLDLAATQTVDAKAIQLVESALDPHVLFEVDINPESRVKVKLGAAKPILVESGWRQYLVKVKNEAGVTAELAAISPNAQTVFEAGYPKTASDDALRPRMQININDRNPRPKPNVRDRWLDMMMFNKQPLTQKLSGLGVEYRIIQLYSRDAGQREARISFNVGQGSQDLGFRNDCDILFRVAPARNVKFKVLDENGKPTTAMFTIRDSQGRVYPSQAKRLAPDFPFHPQIYRADGEILKLPEGAYHVDYTRGPEYVQKSLDLNVKGSATTLSVRLARWIDPSLTGWWSGDHHIHAAGCAHYDNPTEGVLATDMARHCRGEDLKVGCNLTWGPCFDYQKQFFTGSISPESRYPYLLRYDVEVSGFGSHQSGHLCLLRLKNQIPPGGDSWKHWPTLGLNTLKWAKKQGAVCGPAHSGNGIMPPEAAIPTYTIPPYNGIGANEYIVDVTHLVEGPDGSMVPAVDFISTEDTQPVAELNMWYHTLNCGYRTRASGETDFPCIFGERVGIGRSYVKLDGKLDFDSWCEGIRNGRCYVSDGMSHLMDFKVGERNVGEQGSELNLAAPRIVHVSAMVAARLPATPDIAAMRRFPWTLEHARKNGNEVPVEVIVNGKQAGFKWIKADGALQEVSFDVPIERSSWVAMRILPSSHTNPVFVVVGGKPIRASKKSAEWCLKGVDVCWQQKQRTYAAAEQSDARSAYEHAREAYRKILSECEVE
ncbi:MAG: CehA/McbA family metallohydrolase [Chthonomonadales bacterium]